MRTILTGLFLFGILFIFGCSTLTPTTFECVTPCHAYIESTNDPVCVKQNVGEALMCTEEYRWEDVCLKYIVCEKTPNGCNTINEGYAACLGCVKNCAKIEDLGRNFECTTTC